MMVDYRNYTHIKEILLDEWKAFFKKRGITMHAHYDGDNQKYKL